MTHTWELNLYYHKCPKCGKIIECRKDYVYTEGHYIKELQCPRCHHCFSLTKEKTERPIGPIFGKPPKPEFDWSE